MQQSEEGSLMPPRKPADRRQGRGTRDLGVIGAVAPPEVPPAPHPHERNLLAATVAAWETFWSSDLAGMVKPVDLVPLSRLFRMYDLRERLERQHLAEPFVAGSTGQIVSHPAAKEIASLDARIDKLEPRFGLTPKGRLELGIAFGAAFKTLEELNRQFDDHSVSDEDPRLLLIETSGDDA